MTNKFEGNKLIYIPVTTSPKDVNRKYPQNDFRLGQGRQLCWWSDKPLLLYNAMMISAYYGMNEIRTRRKIRKEVLFFGDSGGFQVLQYKSGNIKDPNIPKTLTPENVIKWQMKVCDIGMTLDIPTPREWDLIDQVYDKKIFNDRLKESTANAQFMHEYKEDHIDDLTTYNKNFKLFNCIHGAFYNDMERWYNVTTNNNEYEFDGFSLANSRTMNYILPLRLGFAIEHSKGKPFHILGTSSPMQVTLIAYANKYTDTQIYFDSSSAAFGRMIRKYMYIWDFSGNGLSYTETPKYKDFKGLPCPCPVCSQLENPEDLWEEGTDSGILLTLHNLFWMTKYTDFINGLVFCTEEFRQYVENLPRDNSSWILRYMEFLDFVNEKGLETAWNSYFNRNKPGDPSLTDESNTENHDVLLLNPDYNSIIRKLEKTSTYLATKECKDIVKNEVPDPQTGEIKNVKELVNDELAKFKQKEQKKI